MNGLRNGGLISESQIPVNPAVGAVASMYIRDLKQTGRERDDDGYSHNDIPDLVQKK